MFIRILNSEMELATGCTEPGAVALTAAEAGCALRRAGANTVEEVLVSASVNIIKNAMSAGIPGTSYEGMDYAAAIGAVGGEPVHLLEVMNYVAPEQVEQAAALVKAGKVKVEVAQVPQKLYVDVTVKGEGHTGRAVVRDLHTNVVLVQQDGETTLDKTNAAAQSPDGRDLVPPEEIAAFLTVKSIWDYCTEELDPLHDPIDIIRSAVKVNTAISEEGLSKEYGLAIGRNLELNCRKGLMTRDLTTNAMIIASAGADARMAGAPVSVVANSGSGNQGITATMPVVAAARWLDIDEEKMLRAVTLSNLIAIRIKSKFGRLSNLCGATVAGTGAACGITYLLGGGYHEICCAIQNMVGNVTGMVCDGAKADCARKSKVLRKDMVSFGIPLFANIHLCGSVLTEVFFCMTISKILYGKLPGIGTMILFCLLLGIFAIGAPGVPGGTVMASLGLITGVLMFDDAGTALMLAIFALQDSFGTACNVTGDGALTLMLTGYAEKHGIQENQNIESPVL